MVGLDEIRKDTRIRGIVPSQTVQVVSVEPLGEGAATVYYRDADGKLAERLLFKSDEPNLELVEEGRPWSLDGDPEKFRLAAEAYRIHLAHLFDPLMAVNTSSVEPLPHQITAVYEWMLPKQPLRFVLADDPGAGKTIMAGLFMRELMVRGDLKRCLVVAPGGLVEQWQDELDQKFGLSFSIFTRDKVEESRSGNPFQEYPLLIARMDQLARNDELKEKLRDSEWDLVIVDEAHKMSATWYGSELNRTKRYQLGELLGDASVSRHFLLMTATPHNGKEEDFQAFMGLLDADRFYGKYRDSVHRVDVSDLMRRMVKEELVKFNGTPLFPERRAHTIKYSLSDNEAALYKAVTDYVVSEMNRAEQLDKKRQGTVGFALTILQRRLASSPEAIYQSLKRRRDNLKRRLEEAKLDQRGMSALGNLREMSPDETDDFEEETPSEERESVEEEVVDQATASQTIQELKAEIASLEELVRLAWEVRQTEEDRKWLELSKILHRHEEMYDENGARRKLIIFTEHRDTLNYLRDRIAGTLGDERAIVVIHGGVKREERRKAQEIFSQEKEALILLATDAAGEGVNLQRANLMVNYDLPWNPNRLEQRFGRIHRIGQTEVCHLWNLVATGTREGDVFNRLFEKLENERERLGGKVFDILGQVFENESLKQLLLEAIRYGESEEVKNRLFRKVEVALDEGHIRSIMQRNALATEHMDPKRLFAIKEQMEKAQALKLQPHFIQSFFQEAFTRLGGQLKQREPGRFEITHVPSAIRSRDRVLGAGSPVLRRYERVCFEKEKQRQEKKPVASLLSPGHPLIDSVIDLTLEQHRDLLKRGSVLVNRADDGVSPRMLFMIDHQIRDAGMDQHGRDRIISRRMHFVLIDRDGSAMRAGHAPYLDYDVPKEEEWPIAHEILEQSWLQESLENKALAHAVQELVPEHCEEVRNRREQVVDATWAAVQERLTKEINYWSHRYEQLKVEMEAGKQPRMQPENARRRAEELTERLERRKKELEAQRHVASATPLLVGGVLVVPQGLLDKAKGSPVPQWSADPAARRAIEDRAMQAVMDYEQRLGFEPRDVSAEKLGWDIQSKDAEADVRFIEVKGRAKGARTITVTKNEILASFNQPERYFLAIVLVDDDKVEGPYYVRKPYDQEPGFGVTSVNFDIEELLASVKLES